jgi:hypothetical protein
MRLSGRVVKLESARGDRQFLHMTDDELQAEFQRTAAALESAGYTPACGWAAPLPRLVNCLERDLAQ